MKVEEMKWTKEAVGAFNTFSEAMDDRGKALTVINNLLEKEGIAEIIGIGSFYISQGVVIYRRERRKSRSDKILLFS